LETTHPRVLAAPALRRVAHDIFVAGRPDPLWSALVFLNVNTPHDDERAKGLVERQREPDKDRITTGRERPMTDPAA
jgi:hypothetical protein